MFELLLPSKDDLIFLMQRAGDLAMLLPWHPLPQNLAELRLYELQLQLLYIKYVILFTIFLLHLVLLLWLRTILYSVQLRRLVHVSNISKKVLNVCSLPRSIWCCGWSCGGGDGMSRINTLTNSNSCTPTILTMAPSRRYQLSSIRYALLRPSSFVRLSPPLFTQFPHPYRMPSADFSLPTTASPRY
jgi:hypothetical protein